MNFNNGIANRYNSCYNRYKERDNMIKTEYVIYRGKQVKYEDLKPHSVKPITVICDCCGKEFQSTKYQIIRNQHELCQQCAIRNSEEFTLPIGSTYSRLSVIGKGSKGGYSLCSCSCNGNVKEYSNYALRSGHTKSCGCLQKEVVKEIALKANVSQKRENHPNWKGGISPLRNCLESTSMYKDIRSKLLSTCNCAKCSTDTNLVIHHIVPYNINPDLFVVESNMSVLCEDCHREYHRLYGHNGNSDTFNEFLKTGTTQR